MACMVTPQALREMLLDGGEIALLDLREEGRFAEGHPLFASSLPLGRLELRIDALVPRRSARIVLCDAADGLAERGADRLARLGYGDVAILEGGIAGWEAAGQVLFSGVHVPSKAFGELVEETCRTPDITAEELKRRLDAGDDIVVLDSRPMDEYRRMNIPTGIDCPGAELAYRVHDIAPSPATTVVVNCAGRTRSIIGAQSLINAGVPNPVFALRDGTMGWTLAGLALETGMARRPPEVSEDGRARAWLGATALAERLGIAEIDEDALAAWREEADRRSLYLLDVRGEEEYAAGHLPGSVSIPGGQLVQCTEAVIGTRNARVVLVDDTGVRAAMTASWLVQMGWPEVAVHRLDPRADDLAVGPWRPAVLGLDEGGARSVSAAALMEMRRAGGVEIVDIEGSRSYTAGHIPGAWFALRTGLARALEIVRAAETIVLTSRDGVLARLAAAETTHPAGAAVAALDGGNEAWAAAGGDFAEGARRMAATADDVWLRPYDRDGDRRAAMNAYLEWERGLVRQIAADGTARFRVLAP